ncbi:MAG: hypothetical protein NC216_12370 [Bacteroides sp.]|nr:hypothetical protein [Bacteroides sp.]
MYNPQIIIDLLNERNIKNSELNEFLGYDRSVSIKQIIVADIRVSKLEKIADFFGVPVDTFFNRTQGNSKGSSVHISQTRRSSISVSQGCGDTASLNRLIAEKDKRIETLEEMVSILKDQIEMFRVDKK